MESMGATFVGLNLLFAALTAAAAGMLLARRANPLLWAYVGMTLLFVYGLPVQQYSRDAAADVLLVSHLLMFSYLLIVLLVARRRGGYLDEIIGYCAKVSGTAIVLVMMSWLVVRVYLFVEHGPVALLFARAQLQQTGSLIELSSLEVALSSITTLLLLGAFAVVTIRHASGRSGVSPLITGALLLMLVLITVTNESPIGSRRLLLALAMLWVSVAWARSGQSLPAWLWRRWRWVGLIGMTVVFLSVYYQHVRHNDLSDALQARTPTEFVAGVFKFATTLDGSGGSEEIVHLRGGPMDFFVKVVDVVVMDGKSSGGEATVFSLATSVPKALYQGEKPVGDVDEVLESYLAIYPDRPFLNIDYSTSLPAIAVADLGPLGVIPAALVLGLLLFTVGRGLRSAKQMPLAVLALLGLGVQLTGSQEAGLTAFVSAARDCALVLFVVVIGRWLIVVLGRSIRTIVRLPVHRATQPLEAGPQRWA